MKKFFWSLLILSIALNAAFIYGKFFYGKHKALTAGENMRNTEKVVKFLQDAKVFYIATIDGNQPRVRPFGAALNINGRLSLCTGARKNVARQIKANPNVEISAMLPDGRYIRVAGSLENNSTAENRLKFFNYMPHLAELYKGKENEFVVLSFSGATATIADMSGNSETVELK
jgi:uncharacterized pyridoxamine 5'-phosphate oxidase family protein